MKEIGLNLIRNRPWNKDAPLLVPYPGTPNDRGFRSLLPNDKHHKPGKCYWIPQWGDACWPDQIEKTKGERSRWPSYETELGSAIQFSDRPSGNFIEYTQYGL